MEFTIQLDCPDSEPQRSACPSSVGLEYRYVPPCFFVCLFVYISHNYHLVLKAKPGTFEVGILSFACYCICIARSRVSRTFKDAFVI